MARTVCLTESLTLLSTREHPFKYVLRSDHILKYIKSALTDRERPLTCYIFPSGAIQVNKGMCVLECLDE